ncbi:MAG: patatin-like phospholipase family protein [Bacterioplanes sp.]|nr:patatin-like phospholipase family protein [Bacterioplanes sp.]
MSTALKIYAGKEAFAHIRQNGLKAHDIAMMLGASGGPKWLSLAAMDRYLLTNWFADRQQPLHLLGTSAGAWRLACYAQHDPLAALARFQEAYINQQYSLKPSPNEVASVCRSLLDEVLGEHGIQEIVQHPTMRYHTIATRCRGLASFDAKPLQLMGLAAAMGSNVLSRSAMRPWLQRTLFHHPERPPIAQFPQLPAQEVALTETNIKQALLATGAIPMVIAGVRGIEGARPGTYRDGGITDYQFDLPILPESGFVLYPHYFAQAPKPGWFDKKLQWRKPSEDHYRRTIMIAPSWEFAASLPGGRIPDLDDFYQYPDFTTRHQRWVTALAQCEQLADELADIDQKQRWDEVVEPLPW